MERQIVIPRFATWRGVIAAVFAAAEILLTAFTCGTAFHAIASAAATTTATAAT